MFSQISVKRHIKNGDSFYQQEDFSSAIEEYLKGLLLDPANTYIMIQLGSIYFQNEDYEECERILLKALEIDSQDDSILQNLGALYNMQNDYAKSKHYLHLAIDHNPRNPFAWNNLGVSLQELNQYQEARAAFEKAIIENPEEFDYHMNLAENYSLQGEFQTSLDYIEKINHHFPNKTSQTFAIKHELQQKLASQTKEFFQKLLQVSTKIKLSRIQEALRIPNEIFTKLIVDWALEYGFVIDGEYLLTQQGDLNKFLSSLDTEFQNWTSTETTKNGKIEK